MTERWRAHFELLRLPAVFTVVADVTMGYLVTHGVLRPGWKLGLLVASSISLYWAGMVLNDVYDAEVDARERPQRPIPSGNVALRVAKRFGWDLLVQGACFAWLVSVLARDWRPGGVSTLLAGCIVLYDVVLKRTPLAPAIMGACRALNVLLGMSVVGISFQPAPLAIAIGIGIYVAGVAIFARHEASISSRRRLAVGIAVMLAGIGVVVSTPAWAAALPALLLAPSQWYLLWGLLTLVIARRCVISWKNATPQHVQQAVRTCLRSIIVIDAAIALGYCGPFWGCTVLALLAPMLLLERWFDTT